MRKPAVANVGGVVVCRITDKIKWLNIDGVFYVHPDYAAEFERKHDLLIE